MKHLNHIALAVTVLTCGFAQAQMTDFNPSWYISPSVNVSQPDNQMGADRNTNGIGLRIEVQRKRRLSTASLDALEMNRHESPLFARLRG